jgi:hypothetical protein
VFFLETVERKSNLHLLKVPLRSKRDKIIAEIYLSAGWRHERINPGVHQARMAEVEWLKRKINYSPFKILE